jgi:autotransporter-associated beta strand protein
MFNTALNSAQISALGASLSSFYGITNTFPGLLPAASPIVFTAADGVLDISDGTATVGSLAGVAGSQVLLGSGALTIGADNSSPVFNGVINGTGSVTKTGTGVQTLTATHGYTGATTVNGGTLRVSGSVANSSGVNVTAANATFEAAASQRVKSLNVSAGQAKVTNSGPITVLTIGDNVNPAPLTIASEGKLDLTTNAVVIDHPTGADASTLQLVRSKIIAGYNGGNYQGNGITSSSAAADGKKAVGYAKPSEVTLGPGNTFLGTGVDSSSVLIRYTLNGDANLDGAVGFEDLVAVAQHYNQNLNDPAGAPTTFTNSTWTHGDFNYDGTVGFADLVAVAQNYGGSLPSAVPGASADFNGDLAAAFASVPEPSSALFILGVAGLSLGRRVRSRRSKV